MTSGDSGGEYEHAAHAVYLSDRFIENAPTDKGLAELREYFDQKLVVDTMNGMRDRELGFFATDHLPPSVGEKIKKLVDDKGKMVSGVLKMYADFSCASLTAKTPEKKQRYQSAVLGVRTVAEDRNFQLGMDMAAIDHLIEKANSVPGYGGDVIEGQARLVSSNPPVSDNSSKS